MANPNFKRASRLMLWVAATKQISVFHFYISELQIVWVCFEVINWFAKSNWNREVQSLRAGKYLYRYWQTLFISISELNSINLLAIIQLEVHSSYFLVSNTQIFQYLTERDEKFEEIWRQKIWRASVARGYWILINFTQYSLINRESWLIKVSIAIAKYGFPLFMVKYFHVLIVQHSVYLRVNHRIIPEFLMYFRENTENAILNKLKVSPFVHRWLQFFKTIFSSWYSIY